MRIKLSYYDDPKNDITINKKYMIILLFVKMKIENRKIYLIIIHTDFISCFWTYLIILFYFNLKLKVFGHFDGHDLFASVSQVEDLWSTEKQTVSIIEKVLEIMRDHPIMMTCVKHRLYWTRKFWLLPLLFHLEAW